jgi:pimeloyl-ACP methyl ester carboxylesterase
MYCFATQISCIQNSAETSDCLQIYLPGLDGTGLAAFQQFPSICQTFSLMSLNIPVKDRTPFEGLVDLCVEYINSLAASVTPTRPIYLLGESFGGILALAVAANCRQTIDRVILVNPATSYEDSVWPQVCGHLTAACVTSSQNTGAFEVCGCVYRFRSHLTFGHNEEVFGT